MQIYKIDRRRIGTDGKGITDLVAMVGCPLKCKYCVNKELLSKGRPKNITKEKLLEEVLKEACYFIGTGGGVTFGGGEPLLQADEIVEFAKIKPDWLNINIETSLNVACSIEELLPYVNQWIVDIKCIDNEIYKIYTDGDNDFMLQNLKKIKDCNHLIRVPIIKGYKNNGVADIEKQVLLDMGFKNIEIFEYVIR